MDLLMNGLLTAATLFAGGYCWVLARRVHDLKSLDHGLGASIVTLTRQIELARATLDEARSASKDRRQDLTQLIARADTAAGQLRLLLAAVREPEMSTRPDPPEPPEPIRPEGAPTPVMQLRMAPEPAPEEPAEAARTRPAAPVPDVPKPRALAPVENPLRRARGGPAAPGRSEDEILEALSALAGSAGR
jgi:hypothetical protein